MTHALPALGVRTTTAAAGVAATLCTMIAANRALFFHSPAYASAANLVIGAAVVAWIAHRSVTVNMTVCYHCNHVTSDVIASITVDRDHPQGCAVEWSCHECGTPYRQMSLQLAVTGAAPRKR